MEKKVLYRFLQSGFPVSILHRLLQRSMPRSSVSISRCLLRSIERPLLSLGPMEMS